MDNMDGNNKNNSTILIVGIVIVLCCICALLGVGGGYFYLQSNPQTIIDTPFIPTEAGATPTTPTELDRPPVDSVTSETVDALKATIVPPNDAKDLACRFEGKCDVPEVVATSAQPHKVGDKEKFWVSNQDTVENTEITATLLYITPHAYFWAQDGVDT